MSFPTTGRIWIATKDDIKNVILREKVLPKLGPTRDRIHAHRLIGNLLARYIVLCNNLSELYDQTLQVQKRALIESILMSSTKRFLELQKEMQNIEMSQFIFLDDALVELKLTPQNVEFLCPFYFPRKRDIEAQRLLDGIVVQAFDETLKEAPKGLDKLKQMLTPEQKEAKRQKKLFEEAVTMIKAHEKAKQGRIKALNIRLHPDRFKIDELPSQDFEYDFNYRPDQAPLIKVKRTAYKVDLYRPKIKKTKFTFYEPPTFRLNKLGQKVLVKKELQSVEQPEDDSESDNEDEELKKKLEIEKLKALAFEEVAKTQQAAAVKIQKCFRNFQRRKLCRAREIKRMEICGLLLKPDDHEREKLKTFNDNLRKKRRDRKREFDEKFLNAVNDEKARILKLKADCIMEDISDDIRQWFKEFYDEAKDFHQYPADFEGGTILVVTGQTQTPEEFLIQKNKTPAEKAKEKTENKKKKKEAKTKKKKEDALKKKLEAAAKSLAKKQGPTWDFAEEKYISKNFESVDKTFKDYRHEWKFIDELANRHEAPIWDWVTIDAYADVHKELRLIVDDFMRIELELLRASLAVDEKTKYVKSKPKKQKKARKRKIKPAPDVFEGRSLEECYEELKSLDIIRKYPKRSLADFIGDQNFAALELRAMNMNPMPFYGDIIKTLRSLVLGMGPLEFPKLKSLCIAGPPKCGKKFIVDAICTEMDAVVFDLSSKKITKIADVKQFVAFVLELAKRFQPTVIFIDGAHKPYITKIPPNEATDEPKKLGPFLIPGIIKKLSPSDAIMLIGTTNEPWNCAFGQLKSCYEKIICFPPTLDYGTALMTWQKGLQCKQIYNFDASSLARVTRNFSIGGILKNVDHHVDIRRRMELVQKPLTSQELLESLLNGPEAQRPLDPKTIESFNKFAIKIDNYNQERKETMARVQVEMNKAAAQKPKKA